MKCLFFDLDGSLIKTQSGKEFPEDESDWEFNGEVVSKIAEVLRDPDWMFAIVSNQVGIAAGFWTEDQVRNKITRVVQQLADKVASYLEDPEFARPFILAYCKSMDADDEDRKPNPGMLLKIAEQENLILEECLFVGDRLEDMQAAHRAGVPFKDIAVFLA